MRVAALLLLLGCSITPAKAQRTLELHALPPNPLYVPILGNAWTIFASGTIDAGAADRLEQLIEERRIPESSSLYLHFPRGNMFWGIALGKVIRANRLITHVGRRTGRSEETEPGICFSACALAFLGGEYRYVSKDARYGVHQFSTERPSTQDLAIAQTASAAIVEYIRSMGVDTALLSLASKTSKDDIQVLSAERMAELNVVNNGAKRAKWTIESIPDAVYLKGERETVFGMNKVLVICTSRRELILWFIFDPQGRADEAMSFNAISIMFDYEPIPISKFERTVVNGWINTRFSLDNAMLKRLRASRRIGISYQMAYGAPAFLGFDSMPFEDGATKLDGLLSVCRKGN